jgi:hypothetical protein
MFSVKVFKWKLEFQIIQIVFVFYKSLSYTTDDRTNILNSKLVELIKQ